MKANETSNGKFSDESFHRPWIISTKKFSRILRQQREKIHNWPRFNPLKPSVRWRVRSLKGSLETPKRSQAELPVCLFLQKALGPWRVSEKNYCFFRPYVNNIQKPMAVKLRLGWKYMVNLENLGHFWDGNIWKDLFQGWLKSLSINQVHACRIW